MKVTLLASTTVHHDAMAEWYEGEGPDADLLATFSGRACYRSFGKPNPKTATTAGYLAHILEVQHHSVLAHASATFYIEGVSRALTHELVRSRFLAFSQESQRYVDAARADYVEPPAVTEAAEDVQQVLRDAHEHAQLYYGELVYRLEQEGLPRKQAREAARAVLPNATATSIVVTGNLRAWRDFLHQRLSPGADREIRALAVELLRQFRDLAPATFSDFPEASDAAV